MTLTNKIVTKIFWFFPAFAFLSFVLGYYEGNQTQKMVSLIALLVLFLSRIRMIWGKDTDNEMLSLAVGFMVCLVILVTVI